MPVDVTTLDIQPLSKAEICSRFPSWLITRENYLKLLRDEDHFSERDADSIQGSFLQIGTTLMVSTASRCFRRTQSARLSYLIHPPNMARGGRVIYQYGRLAEIEFGDFKDELFLQTYIDAEGLPNVGDGFWEHMVALSKFDEFAYVVNSPPKTERSEAKLVQRSGRSQIYNLIRDFTMHRLCGGDLENLGWLQVRWPIGISLQTLTDEFENAFRRFASINQALYRVRYQRERRRKKTKRKT
jgi:hypothetical protein